MLFLGEFDHRRFPLTSSQFAVHGSPCAVGAGTNMSYRSHRSLSDAGTRWAKDSTSAKRTGICEL